MDPLTVLALATQCVTAAPAPIIAAVALAETGGSPYAITIAGERNDANSFEVAVQSVALALTTGAQVEVGMAGVPVSAFEDQGVSYTEGFSPCRNLAIAGELLRESWQRFGSMEEHWRLAVLEYGSGQGRDGGFAEEFDAAMTEIQVVAGKLPSLQVAGDAAERARTDPRKEPTTRAARIAAENGVDWDVFSRDPSRSLLIYSK